MTSYFSRAIDIYWHKNFSSEEWRDYIPKSLFIVTEALTPTLGPLGSRRGWSYRAEWISTHYIPSGKHTKNYGKSPFLMGKSTISMAIFNSCVKLPEGKSEYDWTWSDYVLGLVDTWIDPKSNSIYKSQFKFTIRQHGILWRLQDWIVVSYSMFSCPVIPPVVPVHRLWRW